MDFLKNYCRSYSEKKRKCFDEKCVIYAHGGFEKHTNFDSVAENIEAQKDAKIKISEIDTALTTLIENVKTFHSLQNPHEKIRALAVLQMQKMAYEKVSGKKLSEKNTTGLRGIENNLSFQKLDVFKAFLASQLKNIKHTEIKLDSAQKKLEQSQKQLKQSLVTDVENVPSTILANPEYNSIVKYIKDSLLTGNSDVFHWENLKKVAKISALEHSAKSDQKSFAILVKRFDVVIKSEQNQLQTQQDIVTLQDEIRKFQENITKNWKGEKLKQGKKDILAMQGILIQKKGVKTLENILDMPGNATAKELNDIYTQKSEKTKDVEKRFANSGLPNFEAWEAQFPKQLARQLQKSQSSYKGTLAKTIFHVADGHFVLQDEQNIIETCVKILQYSPAQNTKGPVETFLDKVVPVKLHDEFSKSIRSYLLDVKQLDLEYAKNKILVKMPEVQALNQTYVNAKLPHHNVAISAEMYLQDVETLEKTQGFLTLHPKVQNWTACMARLRGREFVARIVETGGLVQLSDLVKSGADQKRINSVIVNIFGKEGMREIQQYDQLVYGLEIAKEGSNAHLEKFFGNKDVMTDLFSIYFNLKDAGRIKGIEYWHPETQPDANGKIVPRSYKAVAKELKLIFREVKKKHPVAQDAMKEMLNALTLDTVQRRNVNTLREQAKAQMVLSSFKHYYKKHTVIRNTQESLKESKEKESSVMTLLEGFKDDLVNLNPKALVFGAGLAMILIKKQRLLKTALSLTGIWYVADKFPGGAHKIKQMIMGGSPETHTEMQVAASTAKMDLGVAMKLYKDRYGKKFSKRDLQVMRGAGADFRDALREKTISPDDMAIAVQENIQKHIEKLRKKDPARFPSDQIAADYVLEAYTKNGAQRRTYAEFVNSLVTDEDYENAFEDTGGLVNYVKDMSEYVGNAMSPIFMEISAQTGYTADQVYEWMTNEGIEGAGDLINYLIDAGAITADFLWKNGKWLTIKIVGGIVYAFDAVGGRAVVGGISDIMSFIKNSIEEGFYGTRKGSQEMDISVLRAGGVLKKFRNKTWGPAAHKFAKTFADNADALNNVGVDQFGSANEKEILAWGATGSENEMVHATSANEAYDLAFANSFKYIRENKDLKNEFFAHFEIEREKSKNGSPSLFDMRHLNVLDDTSNEKLLEHYIHKYGERIYTLDVQRKGESIGQYFTIIKVPKPLSDRNSEYMKRRKNKYNRPKGYILAQSEVYDASKHSVASIVGQLNGTLNGKNSLSSSVEEKIIKSHNLLGDDQNLKNFYNLIEKDLSKQNGYTIVEIKRDLLKPGNWENVLRNNYTMSKKLDVNICKAIVENKDFIWNKENFLKILPRYDKTNDLYNSIDKTKYPVDDTVNANIDFVEYLLNNPDIARKLLNQGYEKIRDAYLDFALASVNIHSHVDTRISDLAMGNIDEYAINYPDEYVILKEHKKRYKKFQMEMLNFDESPKEITLKNWIDFIATQNIKNAQDLKTAYQTFISTTYPTGSHSERLKKYLVLHAKLFNTTF